MNKIEIQKCVKNIKRTDEGVYDLIIITDYTNYWRNTFTIRFRRAIPYRYLTHEIFQAAADVRTIAQSLQNKSEIVIIANGHMEE